MPPKLVADLREIAFGPLVAIVELEPVTVRLNELDARLEAHIETMRREAASIKDEQAKLRGLLGDTAKRLGVR